METEWRRETILSCKPPVVPCNNHHLLIAQISLRLLAIILTAISILLLLNSSQTYFEFGQVMTARYTYSSAFRYKLGVDSGVCAFSLLSLIMVYAVTRQTANPDNYFYLLMHDTVMMVMTVSGCSAATAIGYLALYGQEESNWLPICATVGKFCHRVMLSIVLSYMAMSCYGLLYFMDAYKLKYLAMN